MRANILVIDDETTVFSNIKEALPAHNIYYAPNLPKVRDQIRRHNIDIAFVDLNIKQKKGDSFTGFDYIKKIRARFATVYIIAHSGYRDIKRIEEAVRNGASEYMYKGKTNYFSQDFREKINQIVKEKKTQDERRKELERDIVGETREIKYLRSKLKEFAGSSASFLLEGERGTGKENAVNFLVYEASRQHQIREKTCIKIDLSQYTQEELKKIICSNPKSKKKTFLHKANNGILYIKNFDCMDPVLQGSIFEIIQRKKYIRSHEPLHIQFVLGLNASPAQLMEDQKLIPDLYRKLTHIHIPPLRNRKEDIPILVEDWMKTHDYPLSIIDDELWDLIRKYLYPGNIGELKGILRKMLDSHKEEFSKYNVRLQKYEYLVKQISHDSIPDVLFTKQERLDEMAIEVAKLELAYIERALKIYSGKKGAVAQALAISKEGSSNPVDLMKKRYINKYLGKKSKNADPELGELGKYPELIKSYPKIVECYQLKWIFSRI